MKLLLDKPISMTAGSCASSQGIVLARAFGGKCPPLILSCVICPALQVTHGFVLVGSQVAPPHEHGPNRLQIAGTSCMSKLCHTSQSSSATALPQLPHQHEPCDSSAKQQSQSLRDKSVAQKPLSARHPWHPDDWHLESQLVATADITHANKKAAESLVMPDTRFFSV